jgi:predicted  nucleic acid-binding Zn-ribbon protein
VVTIAKKLFKLQQIDLDIQKKQTNLEEVQGKLGESTALSSAKSLLEKSEEYLDELLKQQREMEWELDDIRGMIDGIREKLYGGKIKNPKELVGLEHEIGTMKSTLKQKEDELLNVMGDVEVVQRRLEKEKDQVEKLEVDCQREQKNLIKSESDIINQINDLRQAREALTNSIPATALELYEGIRARRLQVVVKVEQGMCQGCRLTLSMSEWQRAKAGNLVQCGSCGRILYVG